ncbi:hypothetical protein OQA88_781 [Cercophora sp. LCS_1]
MGSSSSKPSSKSTTSQSSKSAEPLKKDRPSTIPTLTSPPPSRTPYIIPSHAGESLTLPGSKSVYRILASSLQTDSTIALFTSTSVAAPAPGFHWHAKTHDIFLVTRGFLKLWNGSKCRIMGPGDFAYVPPRAIHNPEPLGPCTELLGLVAPGDWVDFFREVGEPYEGILVPEKDERDLRALLGPRMREAGEKWDVYFERGHKGPEVGEWEEGECVLPEPGVGYFLRAERGPRWLLGGVLVRPFINAVQCEGLFSISGIESSGMYEEEPFRGCWLTFPKVDHCFHVMEGELRVSIKGGEWSSVRVGETAVVSAGRSFRLGFGSRYVRVISFVNGEGLETVMQRAGMSYDGHVLPDKAEKYSEEKLKGVCVEMGVAVDQVEHLQTAT